jgi:hypothetical protein
MERSHHRFLRIASPIKQKSSARTRAVDGGLHHQMIRKMVLHGFYGYPLSRFSGNAGEAVRVSAFITGCPLSSKS